jgi:hypothetical protein
MMVDLTAAMMVCRMVQMTAAGLVSPLVVHWAAQMVTRKVELMVARMDVMSAVPLVEMKVRWKAVQKEHH